MKKKLFLPVAAVAAAVTMLASCIKNDGPTCYPNTLEKDRAVIDSFIDKNPSLGYLSYNTTYSAYMGVADPGTGSQPKDDSLVTFKYTISLMNGTELASDEIKTIGNMGTPLRLKDLIDQNGQPTLHYAALSVLKKGGKFKVILPSSLYFSCAPQKPQGWKETAPGYSQLIYDYILTDVKAPN
ncbi:hypothetical protein LQ567_25630 [Niabella pedocola]|uniref:Peptidylprolyl isomerase n=1 Tax=Niabella pedocola TaxID=1752077 RepID=A0ABS8PYP7_9BACT|nr:hypothetical protein [Niabella pedocola]MCD2426192.1 hypothetical protein [Niabella pedocola]